MKARNKLTLVATCTAFIPATWIANSAQVLAAYDDHAPRSAVESRLPAETLQVTISDASAKASENPGTLARNELVNTVLTKHGVTVYQQAYPHSKIKKLLDTYELRCDSCDANALQIDLEKTKLYAQVRRLAQPIALSAGNPGGYDPADSMWTAHAKDWLWHLVITESDLAWNMTQGDPNVLVAVVDNGFDVTHPELSTKMSPTDPSTGTALTVADHGTATAAMACGETAPTGGTAVGIMPSVGFNSSVQGLMWAGTSGAHYAAMAMNADVVSVSWFSYCSPDYGGIDQLAIQEILDSGTTIVASAANGSIHCSGQDVFPFSALYDERIIVVTSTNVEDKHNNGAGTHSHYPRVDIGAPGYGVTLALPSSSWGYYLGANGTSFATPFVAGAAALMKSVNSCLKPADVQTILKRSTDPIADAASFPGTVGTGRINVNRAVALAQAADYACPQGGSFDSANCHMGTPPSGTTAFIWANNYYYTPLPGNSCPYPGSSFDGANCFVREVPEGVSPFIWANNWYYENCASDDWTPWISIDTAGGTGDYELLSSMTGVCSTPLAIQCETTSGTYWTQTNDIKVTCKRETGLTCRNADQPDGICENYKVRFYCP